MASSWLLITTLALLLFPAALGQTCGVGYESSCDSVNFTATNTVLFHVNSTSTNAMYDTYNATLIFHWGPENITHAQKEWKIGDLNKVTGTYQYQNEGYYSVGTTLIFHDDRASACSGKTYPTSTLIQLQRTPNMCKWNAETPPPTVSPTMSMGPTISMAPVTAAEAAGGSYIGSIGGRFGIFAVGLVSALGLFL